MIVFNLARTTPLPMPYTMPPNITFEGADRQQRCQSRQGHPVRGVSADWPADLEGPCMGEGEGEAHIGGVSKGGTCIASVRRFGTIIH